MAKTIQGLGRDWSWPENDTQCMKVIFDSTADLAKATKHCKQKRTTVQAGGNMGVWPWVLSQQFARVVTFEPDPECYALMQENLLDRENIDSYCAGLWHKRGLCKMDFNEHERANNRGAQFVVESEEGAYLGRLDSLGLTDCDLIYLDIEGSEMNALLGAYETIDRCKPVIAVEDKGLGTRYGFDKGAIEHVLAHKFGYVVVDRPNRDVILTCAS
jgi:FkbM family methyltransferase